VKEYLDARKAQGFTAIQIHAISKELSPTTDRAGKNPFDPIDDIHLPSRRSEPAGFVTNRESTHDSEPYTFSSLRSAVLLTAVPASRGARFTSGSESATKFGVHEIVLTGDGAMPLRSTPSRR
jgi:hypothetical protein